MRDSSLAAYGRIQKQLSTKRGWVFGMFYNSAEPMCDYQAAKLLGWPINCVTGRRRELEQMGYLVDAGKRSGPPMGYEVHHYAVNLKCLEQGFVPEPLLRKETPRRVSMSVREAARVLAMARRGTRQKPAVRRVPMPLFGEY